MINTVDLGWLAGLLEGEGCFRARNSGFTNDTITISVTMTDEDVVRKAHEIIKLGTVSGPYLIKSGKSIWIWQCSSRKEVPQILMTIYPLMGKRRQTRIKWLLDIWKSIPYDTCKKGHKKNGKVECKICKTKSQIDRRWNKFLGVV
jgi:hypothetical protein